MCKYVIKSHFVQDFVLDVMTVLEVVLADPPYPKDWVTLYFLQNRCVCVHTRT